MNINNQANRNFSEIYNRDNIALKGVFNIISDNNIIIIFSVTHLLFNNNRGDINQDKFINYFKEKIY